MQIVDRAQVAVLASSVVAVGSFDGVHRGHRKLLRTLRRLGDNAGLKTVLVTFDPIPRAVIHPASAPPLICTVSTRLRLLAGSGAVDYCCVLPFDERRRHETFEEFVTHDLIRRFGMKILVVGENFACGRGRKGDIVSLKELGKSRDFSVEAQPIHAPRGLPNCSSSEARRLIQRGDLVKAARLLDRVHEMTGVVLGNRGAVPSQIQVVLDDNLCAPPEEDYLGAVRISETDRWKKAMLRISNATSIGRRTVHVTLGSDIRVKTGDALTMRFAQRVAATT
ncbi:FAD synthetase family protein [Bradyrhizobium mercantei]|uniref:FAD synthetase family protein n=1 Tax=Bradyrhizobium mercantei TaxID=1904807 RepID=UPI0009762B36|nr:FAD synthetase family protein [Bradyrhizobium mercantei]